MARMYAAPRRLSRGMRSHASPQESAAARQQPPSSGRQNLGQELRDLGDELLARQQLEIVLLGAMIVGAGLLHPAVRGMDGRASARPLRRISQERSGNAAADPSHRLPVAYART